MKKLRAAILKEFYSATAFLMRYDECELAKKLEERIFKLICKGYDCKEIDKKTVEDMEDARRVQIAFDAMLLGEFPELKENVALSFKLDALQKCRIEKSKMFSPELFIEDIKEAADLGHIDACKLLGYLYWLGELLPENKETALKVWTSLAVNGDIESIPMLIYAYGVCGDTQSADVWRGIREIVNTEIEAFSPIALSSDHSGYSENEIKLADLIMFIRQKNASKQTNLMDRAMIHYVLSSKEKYERKMERLASDTNYHMVMRLEDQYHGKKFGF